MSDNVKSSVRREFVISYDNDKRIDYYVKKFKMSESEMFDIFISGFLDSLDKLDKEGKFDVAPLVDDYSCYPDVYM